MKYGFIKVAAAIPAVRVADTKFNLESIEEQIAIAEGKGVEIIVFPELSLTSYSCQDLFRQQLLLEDAEHAILMLLAFTRQLDIIAIVGAPVCVGPLTLNCAVVIQQGKILGIVPKTYLPNYDEFYEKRWFASAKDLHPTQLHYAGQCINVSNDMQIFQTASGVKFGCEICEDVWAPIAPSSYLALAGAEIIFNLSATDELFGKHQYLKEMLMQHSARLMAAYVYSSCGFGESTQDIVNAGNAIIYESGQLVAYSERFSLEPQMRIAEIDMDKLRSERRNNTTFCGVQRTLGTEPLGINGPFKINEYINCAAPNNPEKEFILTRYIDPHPFMPESADKKSACHEMFNAQVFGLIRRLVHTKCKNVVLGVSGGLDSTLALLVCVRAFDRLGYDRKGIIGVTMPGFGTTDRTYNNAIKLMEEMGITMKEIDIKESVIQHLKDLEHSIENHDSTYENAQARERTQILMDLSNKYNGLVIGTGDMSELALGWCTFNGDHMSMYAVNSGAPKTTIKDLIRYYVDNEDNANICACLIDVIDTPISPELLPANDSGEIEQKTEDIVGPYELHDFFLYYVLRYGYRPSKILFLAQSAFAGRYTDEVIKEKMQIFFKRFFNNQFKRSCFPDGPKTSVVSLSPRGDWRMPSDAMATNWLAELENL
ncbi:NAD(+) synthase [Prevotella corporis]|uniref:NAD(+) synthase n=1 Tax=Prevotella corporis TaxID=28128 RepID=UPI0023F11B9D|nr:NAD(+) synthase [Prevotella corporis]